MNTGNWTISELIEWGKRNNLIQYLEEAWKRIDRQERRNKERKKFEKLFEKRRKEIIKIYLGNKETFGKSNLEAFIKKYK